MKLKLGMRTLKTGLGIYLAYAICDWLGLERGTLAAITTVVGMQPSLKSSLYTIKNQILATFIGVIFAITIAYYFNGNLIVLAFAAIVTIWLCLTMGWQDSITLAVVTLILVGEAPKGDFLVVVQYRVLNILIGLTLAFALNIIIPPRHNHRLLEKMTELRQAFEDFYQSCVEDMFNITYLTREEIGERNQKIKNLIEEAREIYILSIESKFDYDEKKEKDSNFLIKKSIDAIQSGLEKVMEIHRSIILAPKNEEYQELRENIYDYLKSNFVYYHKILDYILLDKKLEEGIEMKFMEKEKEMEGKIVKLVNKACDLEPMYYYQIVAEARRIIHKAWSLVEEKDKFKIKTREKEVS